MSSARVVLMCGVAGSGKSTYARALEEEGWLRLSIDVEAWRRGHREMPLPVELTDDIRAQQRQALVHAVREGRDVVVDYSFWSRAQRDDYRRLASGAGAEVEVAYCPTDPETARRRIARRNDGPRSPDSYAIEAGTLSAYLEGFEAPGPDETDVYVVGPALDRRVSDR
ncbi:MAG: AAA family ATPase [Nocardioides sp.]